MILGLKVESHALMMYIQVHVHIMFSAMSSAKEGVEIETCIYLLTRTIVCDV